MNKKQTAVEWLINELSKTRDYQRVINEINQKSTSVRDIIAEAKEMEKQQHKVSYWESLMSHFQTFEHYWDGTYRNNNG